jgi:hypothetical protein
MYLPYKGFSIIGGRGGVEGDEFLDEGTEDVLEDVLEEVLEEVIGDLEDIHDGESVQDIIKLGVIAEGLSSTGDSFDFGL